VSEPRRLLVVDDDREIRDLVSRFLVKHGYKVTAARDAREMTAALGGGEADLIILDVMLPGRSGLELCRDLRGKSDIPILMLTAMGEETDRIVGLEMGADDYLPKPFNARELLARIRAILRRAEGPRRAAAVGRALRFSGWILDRGRRRLAAPDGVVIDLTSGEYELLTVFAEHRSAFSPGTNCSILPAAAKRCRLTAASTCKSAASGARSRPIPSRR